MRHKPAAIEQHIHHAGLIVNDNDCRRTQPQATDFTGTCEIQFRIEFLFREKAHADPARDNSLGLSTLPDTTSMFFDQFASRDTKW